MEIMTCGFCGKVFSAAGVKACASCRKELEDVYQKARTYLRDHFDSNIGPDELAKALDVDPAMIQFLKSEGRFSMSDEEVLDIDDDTKRRELLKEFQNSIKPAKLNDAKEQNKSSSPTSYTGEKHRRN